MSLFLKLYDKQILRYILFVSLMLWGATSSIALLLKKDHLVVVRVDDFGTTVLSEANAETATIETENFLNNFIGLFYNYTVQNFDTHIDKSFEFLEPSVAESFIPKLNDMSERVKTRDIRQSAFAARITKIKEGHFEIELEVLRMNGLEESNDKYKLVVILERTGRSVENPYGLLITKLQEIYE
jgi:hypothetical protein